MGNLIEIAGFDTQAYPKRPLSADVSAGDTSIPLTSTLGLAVGDWVVVGIVFAPTAELRQITGITASTVAVAALSYAHKVAEGSIVTLTHFDKIKLYSGAGMDISEHTDVVTMDMLYSNNTEAYMHGAGTPLTNYSYTYYNSSSSVETERRQLAAYGLPMEITPEFVKTNYLYGLDLTDDNLNPLPDSVYWIAIKSAYAWLENVLQIDLIPKTYEDERRDFEKIAFKSYVFLQTLHYPVQAITKVAGEFYGGETVFPLEWLRMRNEGKHGQFNLVPVTGSFTQFLISANGNMVSLFDKVSDVPGFWKLDYTTGFADGAMPYDIRDVIAKRACFAPLNIMGDLVGGAGIASKSTSIDGLSQSISTTSSAENAGYSGRLRQYEREFKLDLANLRKTYRRMSIGVI